jgi:lysozyme
MAKLASSAGAKVGGGFAAVLLLAAGLIRPWEGERFTPYLDAVGVPTVCYGHTGDVIAGKAYTRAECNALLDEDMREANAAVRRCLTMPMLVQEEAALTSAAFNLGPQVVCGSTLQRKAKANDWPGACAELDRWNKAGGRVFKGLVLRRADERAVCEGRALWENVT